MTYVGTIGLTTQEAELLGTVKFELKEWVDDTHLIHAESIPKLMNLLEARGAIPKCRLEYFNNPDFRSGRPKGSHRSLFERNGTSGTKIYAHFSFLKYLRYFVYGVDLPAPVIAELRPWIERHAPIGSSEVLDLLELAKAWAKQNNIALHDNADEFFKLCLECDVYLGHATRLKKYLKECRA